MKSPLEQLAIGVRSKGHRWVLGIGVSPGETRVVGQSISGTSWCAEILQSDGLPSRGCIEVNAKTKARHTALCQQAELVPVVEPEVLMDGDHMPKRCARRSRELLHGR